MRWFGLGKKAVAAEIVGRNLTAHMIEADDCWRDVCMLRSYETEAPIATCEMAFARAALTKSILTENQHPGVAERINQAADTLILESFKGEDTEVTRAFYEEEMEHAAPKRVAYYSNNVFPPTQLASVLGATLEVAGPCGIEGAFMFREVEKRVRGLIATIKIV